MTISPGYLVHTTLQVACGDLVIRDDVHDRAPSTHCIEINGVQERLTNTLKQLFRTLRIRERESVCVCVGKREREICGYQVLFPQCLTHSIQHVVGRSTHDKVVRERGAADEIGRADKGRASLCYQY